MKMRNKRKVHPSPSSSSSSSSSSSVVGNGDAISVLKLLPTAILTLVSVLSLEDKEALAYMITMSMKSANPSLIIEEKKSSKKSAAHKPPVFDCDCFDCYTSYWFRWDSSPNRELIHQAIEAFEDHLTSGEQSKKNNRGKKREKTGHYATEKANEGEAGFPEADSSAMSPPAKAAEPAEKVDDVAGREEVETEARKDGQEREAAEERAFRSLAANNHKGLARKVLPDVVGLLNSRLWSLWSPNI